MNQPSGRLAEWRNFEECLLHDVHPVHFGYSLDLVINYVWEGDAVREDALTAPELVTLRMIGLESLRFEGGLTCAMRANPDDINWGLTEIVGVFALPATVGVTLAVEWEGDRRLEARFATLDILTEVERPLRRPFRGPTGEG